MPHDSLPIGGEFKIEVIRDTRDGPKVIHSAVHKNLVVDDGKLQIVRMIGGLQTKIFDQMRIGTSAVAATAADANLKSPVTGTLETVGSIDITGSRTLQLVHSYASGGSSKSAVVAEVAILNENTSPGGSCMARAVLSPTATKTTADKLKITYTLRLT